MICEPIRRRQFITLLGGAAAVWPVAATAQQAAMPVVGFLFTGASEGTERLVAAFRNGLSETGYVEGRNVAVDYRWAFNDRARLSEFATDMVRRRVAVIAAPGGSPAALAAQAATKTIPIVFIVGVDPEQAGLVASLNRPGGNITGFTDMAGAIVTKRFGTLRAGAEGPTLRCDHLREHCGDCIADQRPAGGGCYHRTADRNHSRHHQSRD
jgi:putative ABC transport system substrate-binding protein